jgi:hypothetical protein
MATMQACQYVMQLAAGLHTNKPGSAKRPAFLPCVALLLPTPLVLHAVLLHVPVMHRSYSSASCQAASGSATNGSRVDSSGDSQKRDAPLEALLPWPDLHQHDRTLKAGFRHT